MNNDVSGADLRRWGWFIIFDLLGGLLLAADVRMDAVIFMYAVSDLPEAGVLMKYKVIAEYTLFAVANLLGLVKLLYFPSGNFSSRKYSSRYPWWNGR